MKTVYLPAWMEEHANFFAKCYVEEVEGLGVKDSKYDKAINKAKQKFLTEAYEEALTPHLTRNPSTKIAADSFAVFNDELFAAKGSFLDARAGGVGSNRYDEFARQLKGAVTHLAHLYLTLEMGMKLKQKQGGRTSVEFSPDMSVTDQLEAVKARYYRAASMILILSGIESVFSIPGTELKKIVDEKIAGKGLGDLKDDNFRFDVMFEIKEEAKKFFT
jgi:hypothetical protein